MLAVDMKFPIHIRIHIHRFFRGYPWEYPWIHIHGKPEKSAPPDPLA